MGCGSVSLCQQLIQITCTVGDEVLFGWRSFEIYPLQVRTAGATPVQVPLTDHTYDLDAMLAAITDRTRLIFVCNPNNPTSTVVDPDALARFVEAVPSDILIALDEAYVEYIRDGHAARQFRTGPRPQQCRCAADVLEGLRAGRSAHRLCRRRSGHHHRAGQGLRAVHRDQRLAGRRDRLPGRRRRAARAHRRRRRRTRPGDSRAARRRLHRAAVTGQLRLAAAGRTRPGVRRRAPPTAGIIVRPYGEDGVRVTVAAPHENDAFLEFASRWIGAQMTDTARKTFAELTVAHGPIPDAELDAFWATLAPASIDFMIGEWKGGEFDTGHRADGFMERLNWFGKTFVSATDANRWSASTTTATSSPTSSSMNGEASLWMEEFRGEVTATMVYDGQPIHDHFKKIDDNAVMGIMNGKAGLVGRARYLYFYLERV